MLNHIFSTPIFCASLPEHDAIKSAFMPHLINDSTFEQSKTWDCDCDTTHNNLESNGQFPWELFYTNMRPMLEQFLTELGIIKQYSVSSSAWVNRYRRGQHQEIHAHSDGKNVISCAYMLHTPQDTGQFIFYKSGQDFFQRTLLNHMPLNGLYGNRHNPLLKEGDIIFFPSNLDHYVTYNTVDDQFRSTISANFSLTFIEPIDKLS